MAKHLRKLSFALALGWSASVFAVTPQLSFEQSQNFRSWFIRIVKEQLAHGPNPRWTQRDCAGLVRFGTYESMRTHDGKWLKANGLVTEQLPPEVRLTESQQLLLNSWKQVGSSERKSFAPAIGIVQENSQFVSKDLNLARPGDLLFFDQGDDQHLMIWMGSYIAYHTGTQTKKDTGLRSVNIDRLMNWKDTRWQPRTENPNFIGIYRLSFLSY